MSKFQLVYVSIWDHRCQWVNELIIPTWCEGKNYVKSKRKQTLLPAPSNSITACHDLPVTFLTNWTCALERVHFHVTVMSQERYVVSIIGNSTVCSIAWPGRQWRKQKSSTLLSLWEGNPPVTRGLKIPVMRKGFPCRYVFMIGHARQLEVSIKIWP